MRVFMMLGLVMLGATVGVSQEAWVIFPESGKTTRDQLKRQLNEEAFRHLQAR